MIDGLSLGNLLAWMLQVLVFASAAAALPLVFRVRHPRTQLAYCHLALIACMLLPWMQRWHHPVIVTGHESPRQFRPVSAPEPGPPPSNPPIPWNRVVFGVLAAGAGARLGWMLAGLWQIRRHRTASRPLYPPVASVEAARAITGADASICISAGPVGPATFGFFRPVILLPVSFLELGEEAQSSIVCHELLHVRRHDWLVTMFEESAAVLFWFHPAVWWLLAQTRLAREQLVDSEVVRLTAGCEAYVNALLAIAGAEPNLDLVPAPLFLRRRHLTQRVHSLLKEVTMSKLRLLASYVSITAILALATGTAFLSFPLIGQPQVNETAAADGLGIHVDPGGSILYRPSLAYPLSTARNRTTGTVVLDLTLDGKGQVADARVVSGPQELRHVALQSALMWRYAPGANTAGTVKASIDFGLPASAAADPIEDPVCRDTKERGVLYSIDVGPLPQAMQGAVYYQVQDFLGQTFSNALMCQILAVARGIDSGIHAAWLPASMKKGDTNIQLTLSMSAGPPGPRPGEKMMYQFPNPGGALRANGALPPSFLIHKVEPLYPVAAKAAGVTGTVKMVLLVGVDGHVLQVHVDSGPDQLQQAAIDAVKQWIYQPISSAGRAYELQTPVQVTFGNP
jgi:TonB family protein